ncbi:unnamed protein product, partial [Prorocentrum cordatum]
ADLWSLGALLYMMLEGCYPFDSSQAVREVRFADARRPSQAARDLISGLMRRGPHERLPLESCLRHPWVILPGGALSRAVDLCEDCERRRRREREMRAPLPSDPRDVRQLRIDLQQLTVKFRRPVTLCRREVVMSLSGPAMPEDDEAWEQVALTLARHFPGAGLGEVGGAAPAPLRSAAVRGGLSPVAEAASEELPGATDFLPPGGPGLSRSRRTTRGWGPAPGAAADAPLQGEGSSVKEPTTHHGPLGCSRGQAVVKRSVLSSHRRWAYSRIAPPRCGGNASPSVSGPGARREQLTTRHP